MPKLENPRYELFATLMATGELAVAKAYLQAGFSATNRNSANASGRKLLAQPTIAVRIQEIRDIQNKRVADASEALLEAVENAPTVLLARNLKDRVERVAMLAEWTERLEKAMLARAADQSHAAVPGMDQGVVTVEFKGKDAKAEYKIDTGPVNQIKLNLEYLAKELGQWVDKSDVDQRVKSIRDIPDDVLEDMIRQGREAAKAKPDDPHPESEQVQ